MEFGAHLVAPELLLIKCKCVEMDAPRLFRCEVDKNHLY